MESRYDSFGSEVDSALSFFLRNTSATLRLTADFLTRVEKLDWLQRFVQRAGGDCGYLERFKESIRVYTFADRERSRIMRRCCEGEAVSLYELSQAMDWLGTAASLLDEFMCCEHRDYQRQNYA